MGVLVDALKALFFGIGRLLALAGPLVDGNEDLLIHFLLWLGTGLMFLDWLETPKVRRSEIALCSCETTVLCHTGDAVCGPRFGLP